MMAGPEAEPKILSFNGCAVRRVICLCESDLLDVPGFPLPPREAEVSIRGPKLMFRQNQNSLFDSFVYTS